MPRARPGCVVCRRDDQSRWRRCSSSGKLTAVWVPEEAHEAMRDLCRARQAAMQTLRRARQQVLSFLLRNGRVYSAGGHWTRMHRLSGSRPNVSTIPRVRSSSKNSCRLSTRR